MVVMGGTEGMSDKEKNELLLALKEILRQAKKMVAAEGADAIGADFPHGLEINDLETALHDYRAGLATAEEAEAEIARIERLYEQAARELGDPAMIMAFEAENDAKARELSDTAQLLVGDASKAAGQGKSPEEWIWEVLRGHANDEDAQRRCLQLIVDLWSNGPWPWPRTTC
jgi:hypothetical protein